MNAKKVAVIMGSDSDWPILKPAVELLKQFGIAAEVTVASAHRTPAKVRTFVVHEWAETAADRGIKVIVAAAGKAAHLGGVVAAFTPLPVIGVPINATSLNGMDALLSTVQMPSGIPVATMAINGAKNAAIFAVEMFSIADDDLKKQLADYRAEMVAGVEKKAARVAAQL